MRIERRVLGQLRIAVVPIAGLRSVASILALEAGQLFEPQGRPGVARLVAQTLLRGTERRDAKAWTEAIDDLGASARLDVGSQGAFFSGQCLAGDLTQYLGLVAEAVLHPALAEGEVEFVRAQTIAHLIEDAKDTRAVAESAWRELAYPEAHPFHTRALGAERVIREATAAELRAFHRRRVIGGSAQLVLVGGVDPATAFEAAAHAFGEWPAPERTERAMPQATALATVRRRDVTVPDKTQSDVVLGWHGLPRRDARFVAARVTNMVFAADTFASRAGFVVRDELGLAYYVFSTLAASTAQGPWVVRMGVNPENVERAIETVLAELRKIHAGNVRDEDLDLARDKLVGELEVALESPGGVAQLVLEAEMFGLGDDHFERYPRELRSVTKAQVVDTARAYLSLDRYALATAGPPLP